MNEWLVYAGRWEVKSTRNKVQSELVVRVDGVLQLKVLQVKRFYRSKGKPRWKQSDEEMVRRSYES